MIYTVTLNPSLDMVSYVDELDHSAFVQTTAAYKYPGGKGINVSRSLYNLDIFSIATGFLGGYPGEFIRDWFEERQIDTFFLPIKDDNRTTLRIKSAREAKTIAGISPSIPQESLDELLHFLSRIREGDIVVIGGSLPKDVPGDIYKRISEICNANKAHFTMDIPAKEMVASLRDKPLLIKPNIDNLALMFDKMEGFDDEVDIIEHGFKCIDLGARNVIVSLGEDGSYLFTEDKEVYRSYGVKGEEVNSFNSRDAMIGAFIGSYMKKNDPVEAFEMAAAAASATAFVEDFASKEEVMKVYEEQRVEKIR